MKLDHLRIPKNKDKRRHLTDDDKVLIIHLFKIEGWGIRPIARKFAGQCTRRMIQFVLFPERLIAARKNYDWKKYYTTAKHKEDMRKHRAYKKEIFKN